MHLPSHSLCPAFSAVMLILSPQCALATEKKNTQHKKMQMSKWNKYE